MLKRLRRLLRLEKEEKEIARWEIERIFYPEDFIVTEMSPKTFQRFAKYYEFIVYQSKDRQYVFDSERRRIFTARRTER